MRRTHSIAAVILASLAAVILAACSGIPSSTTPQVVRTLNANPAPAPITPPPVSTPPQTIVSDFVHANADADTSHSDAQQYLTTTAAQTWKQEDAGATIFSPAGAPSLPDSGNVRVTGTQVGILSAAGAFSLPSATPYLHSFHLVKTAAGWRITNPPPGLLLRSDDFRSAYHASPLYFFSSDQSVLVPDLRYASANGQSLADLLLTQLLDGPSTLSSLSDEFPSQIVNTKVTVGTPIEVQLPGFGKLTADNRTRIAAEIAYTFGSDAFPGKPIEIQDGTTTVPIAAGENTFTESSTLFKAYDPMRSMNGQSVYYIRKGTVYNQAGRAVDGVYGGSVTGASSVAISTRVALGQTPLEAAVVSEGHELMVGNAGTLDTVKLPAAATSRPDWTRNGLPEVWIGVGHSLVRISSTGVISSPAVSIPVPQGSAFTYRSVDAVRFSPDGTRVALVLSGVGTTDSSSGWIGNVVRTAGTVSIEGLYQFTPKGWYVRDVAWTDALALDAIDNPPTSLSFRVYSLKSDGSQQKQLTSANEQLPASPAPRWITAGTIKAGQADTWVSVGVGSSATLWRMLPAPDWLAPFGTSSYLGSAPNYSGGPP